MPEQTTSREERAERLRRLRAREAARKVHTSRGPLTERPLLDQISFVLFDPGAITPRGDNYQEPLWRWQARAIAYLLDEPTPQLTNTPVPTEAAEIDRLRAELDNYKDHLDHLERCTLPNLRREIQHHQDGKKRWRDRAEKAEARVVELEQQVVGLDDLRLRAIDKGDALRDQLAEQQVQIEKLQGLHTCPALATNLDRCCKTPGHSGDHSSFAGRHIWSPAHAAEAARLHHCPAEYGGPGYSHCELTAGHDGQHEAAMGNMRRATWGGDL